MPARANISINDGETTPVAHVFVPDGDVGPGHSRFINRNATAPAASEYLFIKVSRSQSPGGEIQTPAMKVNPDIVEMRIKYPATYVDSTTGLTLVDFIDEGVYRRLCHPRSSVQRRKNLRFLFTNGLQNAAVLAAHDNTEVVW